MLLGESNIPSGRQAANLLGICVAFVAGAAARRLQMSDTKAKMPLA
jgi:hypothetical protein